MANKVIITAGGIGARVGSSTPKQFLDICGKPLIAYTLKKFQQSPDIDEIIVSCVDGWQEYLNSYAKQIGITKLKKIVNGGATNFDSIYNALNEMQDFTNSCDLVLVHDGNRPNVDEDIIHRNVTSIRDKGNAVTAMPCPDVVFDVSNEKINIINRDNLLRIQTPQGATFKTMLQLYNQAIHDRQTDLIGFCSLLCHYDYDIQFVMASDKNFKVTYPEDVERFRAQIAFEQDEKTF